MKITNQTHPAITDSTSKQKSGGTVENQGFAALLKAEFKIGPEAIPGGASPSGPGFDSQSAASLIGRLMAGGQAPGAQNAASGADRLNSLDEALGALANYAQALADPKQSLKNLAPLAEALEPLAGRLSQAGREVDDPVLKSLFEQTAVTATVEAMKFKRGDYV